MAVAARKAFFEPVQTPVARPAPRLAGENDKGGPSAIHEQQRLLEAAFSERHANPRLRAISYSLLTVASIGMWAAIIDAAVHVGHMLRP